MSTEEVTTRMAQEKAEQLAVLERIRALADEIYQRVGHNDILEALDRSRESYP